jgi:electron transfer flavoprotein alpha subunit
MESILVLTHADETGSALTKASLEAVTAGLELAAQLGASLTIGIVAANAASAASSVACHRSPHAGRLRRSRSPSRAMPPMPPPAKLFAAPRRPPSCSPRQCPILARRRRRSPSPRRLHRHPHHRRALGAGGTIEATRWFYRQRVEAVLSRDARPWFLLLDAGTHAAFAGAPAAAPGRRDRRRAPGDAHHRQRPPREPKQDEQTIRPDAKLLFVAGAGWTKKQPDGQIPHRRSRRADSRLPQATGASLGSSKSLVDQGGEGNSVLPFLTHMNQIGQTGATPRHAKGLSTCCHGEEPHVVGWRFIAERRAISLDPNCGWTRGKADVVYVADAFQGDGQSERAAGGPKIGTLGHPRYSPHAFIELPIHLW